MNNERNQYRALLERYLNEDISQEEAEELFEYLAKHPEKAAAMLGPEDRLRFEEKMSMDILPDKAVSDRMHRRLLQGIKAREKDNPADHTPVIPVKRFVKTTWKWAAAIVLLTAGTYYVRMERSGKHPATVSVAAEPADVEPPQSNQAFITLSTGQKIELNGITENNLTEQDGTKILKGENGELIYQAGSSSAKDPIAYNTLWNPRGSRVVQMKFSDGSRVWLNAGSSVTYPVRFSGNKRRVSLEGEAYFEVAHNSAMPFMVNNGATDITVLGTRFNVKAYEDEETRITLLEGSVKVDIPGAERLLTPGQQVMAGTSLEIADHADLEEVMAWKNGLFRFENADIYAIMRTVARWYDIKVVYEDDISADRFQGTISMDTRLSELLEVLELNKVEYSIENRTVKIKAIK